MKNYILSAIFLTIAGCARFQTTQTDERINEKTGERTKVTTKASSTTFFDSRSALSSFKATQTEKSQGASVGSLNQDANSTNAVSIVESVTRGAVEGAIKAVTPKP